MNITLAVQNMHSIWVKRCLQKQMCTMLAKGKLYLRGQNVIGFTYQSRERMYSTGDVKESAINKKSISQGYKEFSCLLPDIISDLTIPWKNLVNDEICDWIVNVLEYNITGGKMIRGLNTCSAFKIIAEPSAVNPENIRLANVLGWCVEVFQASFLVTDDIMDNSETRRGKPCWHKQAHVGLTAINDSMFLSSAIFAILQTHFQNDIHYSHYIELLNKVILYTCVGQYLDMTTSKGDKPNLKNFTMERYKSIVKYKTAYYTLALPVNMAMILAKITDPATFKHANDILLKIGELFQIQDDYLDCFGDISTTGKKGIDIEEGKCSWLAVTALERANESQREVMKQSYGSKNPADVQRIKNLYEEMDLRKVYKVGEQTSYDNIVQQAKNNSVLPPEVFLNSLNQIYNRNA